MSPPAETWPKSPSILGIHPGALGDVILFGRLLARLEGRKTIVTAGDKAELLVGLGRADRAVDFAALPVHLLFTEGPDAARQLADRLGRCDVLVSCFTEADSQAGRRLRELCQASSAHFLPVRPPAQWEGHLVNYWAVQLGLDSHSAPQPAWRVPDAWRAEARGLVENAGIRRDRPYRVIHPGAGSPAKCWPLERFAELARGGGPEQAIFVFGPVERDIWARERLDALAGEFPVLSCPRLPVLAGLLAGAARYVGNDSGTSHLAAAVGVSTLALFGPTRPEQFAPLGPAVRTLRREPLAELATEEVADVWAALAEEPS